MRFKSLELLLTRLALIPELEVHEKRGIVRGARKTQQAESDKAGGLRNTRRIHDGFFDFLDDGIGALERSAIRKLQANVGVALIFVGEETRWDAVGEESSGH